MKWRLNRVLRGIIELRETNTRLHDYIDMLERGKYEPQSVRELVNILKKEMKEKGLTMTAIAKETGLSLSCICQMMKGTSLRPTLESFNKITKWVKRRNTE